MAQMMTMVTRVRDRGRSTTVDRIGKADTYASQTQIRTMATPLATFRKCLSSTT